MDEGANRTLAPRLRQSATSLNVSAIFMGMRSTMFFCLSLRARYIPVVLSGLGIFAFLLVVAACFAKLILPE
jgi:hypothetical protein